MTERMKIAYGYRRVSKVRVGKDGQKLQGMSIDAQTATIEAYFKYKLEAQGFVWGGWFTDDGVSGKTPFIDRPAGGELSRLLEKGDAIVFAKLDRGFRSLEDLITTVRVLTERGIDLHMLDISVDTASPVGRLILAVIGAIAEFERMRISERTREALAALKAAGRPCGPAPYGYRSQGIADGTRRLFRFPEERALGKKVVELRRAGWSVDAILLFFIKHKVRHPRTGSELSRGVVQRMFTEEVRLQQKEAEGPPRLPQKNGLPGCPAFRTENLPRAAEDINQTPTDTRSGGAAPAGGSDRPPTEP